MGGNGDPAAQSGAAVHLYAANASMTDRFFYDADGELLLVPQEGALTVRTELGILEVAPGEICVVPRGVKFRVELAGFARGYVCENYGAHFRLPELGPIGTIDELAPGESATLTKTMVVEADSPTRNIATADGEDVLGKQVVDDDDATIIIVVGEVITPLPRTGLDLDRLLVASGVLLILGGVLLLTGVPVRAPARGRRYLG